MKTMANGKHNIRRKLVPYLKQFCRKPVIDLSNIPQTLYLSHNIKTIYSMQDHIGLSINMAVAVSNEISQSINPTDDEFQMELQRLLVQTTLNLLAL